MSHTITPAPAETYIVNVYEDSIECLPVLAYEFFEDDNLRYTWFRCAENNDDDISEDLGYLNVRLMRVTGLLQPSGRVYHGYQIFDDLRAFKTFAQKQIMETLQYQAESSGSSGN